MNRIETGRNSLSPRLRRPRSARWTVAPLAAVLLAALLALAAGLMADRAGDEVRIQAFTRVTAVVSGAVVGPHLTSAMLSGEPAAQAALGRAVDRARSTRTVSEVRVRTADGRVVWSSDPDSVGRVVRLRPAQGAALRTGSIVVTPAADRGGATALMDGSAGVVGPAGVRSLVDVTGPVELTRLPLLDRFWPTTLLTFAGLLLVQVPLMCALPAARRSAAEAAVAHAAADATDAERHRIAAEVHDEVLPELMGIAYELDAVRLRSPEALEPATAAAHAAAGIRRNVAGLRGLLLGLLSPRPLPDCRLREALQELADNVGRSGHSVTVALHPVGAAPELDDLPRPVGEILYRCAREVLRNVVDHSRAERVDLTIDRSDAEVIMTIDDDGCGFDEALLTRREAEGHLGLRSLGQVLAEAGGTLTVSSAPGQGTRSVIRLQVDRQPAGTPR